MSNNVSDITSKAIIYLSGERGRSSSRTHQSFHVFKFGSYQKLGRDGFRGLVALNDDTLLPQSSLAYSIPAGHSLFILAVIGQVACELKHSGVKHVDVGQSLSAFFPEEGIVTISNSYATEAVNCIVCWYRSENPVSEGGVVDFNFEHNPDCMIPLTQGQTKLSIGRFSARIDQSLITTTQNVFVFVLEGAFEFQDRLLEQKDALSLTNVSSVDFEALSNDAILMIAEL